MNLWVYKYEQLTDLKKCAVYVKKHKSVCSSPCFCSKQLIVVGGPLVIILSVSDDGGEAFTDQSFSYVTGNRKDRRKGAG